MFGRLPPLRTIILDGRKTKTRAMTMPWLFGDLKRRMRALVTCVAVMGRLIVVSKDRSGNSKFAISHRSSTCGQLKMWRKHAHVNYESVATARQSDEAITATAGDANDAARAGGGKTKIIEKGFLAGRLSSPRRTGPANILQACNIYCNILSGCNIYCNMFGCSADHKIIVFLSSRHLLGPDKRNWRTKRSIGFLTMAGF